MPVHTGRAANEGEGIGRGAGLTYDAAAAP